MEITTKRVPLLKKKKYRPKQKVWTRREMKRLVCVCVCGWSVSAVIITRASSRLKSNEGLENRGGGGGRR